MGYRRFVDRDGNSWEVRDRSSSEWEFTPISGNSQPPRLVRAPGYESDPFELSIEEMQHLLDQSAGPAGPKKRSPFLD